MDLGAIQGAISSLKVAAEISKSFLDLKNQADVQGKVIELQGALLDAQNSALAATASQFELLDKIRDLEAKLKERGDWETQRRRYLLVNPWRGPSQAYALREAEAGNERPHLLCSTCFHGERRVILNPVKNKDGWVQMVCPSCRSTMDTGYRGIGPATYAEAYVPKDEEGSNPATS